jgi:predicted aspartyl protease
MSLAHFIAATSAVLAFGTPTSASKIHATGTTIVRDTIIPVEIANKTIFIQVVIGDSTLWFVLDTGDTYAVVDLAVAKKLGLDMGDEFGVTGGGKETVIAKPLKHAFVQIAGTDLRPQPLVAAISLERLANLSGHAFDGILGYQFIRDYVIEIDYARKVLILHDPASYRYTGHGDVLPLTFNTAGHPQIRGEIIDGANAHAAGIFVVDIGSGATIILNTPFVDREHLLADNRPTVNWFEGRGIGGGIDGVVGRLGGFRLGRTVIPNPITIFARTSSGAFASPDVQGNLGAAIFDKFNVTLDYAHNRIILEPNTRFARPTEYDKSGLSLESFAPDFRRFQVVHVARNSPAAEAGVQVGDVLVEIDERSLERSSLSDIRSILATADTCRITILRGAERVYMTLALRRRV